MLNSTFTLITIYLHFYYDIGVKPKKMNVFCTAYIIKMALTAIGAIYLILLAISRVYLGAHSWNQVLFGALIGSFLAFIGHYTFKSFFYCLWDRSLIDQKFKMSCIEIGKLALMCALCVITSLIVLAIRIDEQDSLLNND